MGARMRKRAGEVGSQRPLRANASQHTDCDVVFGGRGRGVVVAPVDGPTHGHNWYHSSTAHGMVHAGESNTTQVPRWPSKHLTPHPSVCVCVRGGAHSSWQCARPRERKTTAQHPHTEVSCTYSVQMGFESEAGFTLAHAGFPSPHFARLVSNHHPPSLSPSLPSRRSSVSCSPLPTYFEHWRRRWGPLGPAVRGSWWRGQWQEW